MNNQYTLYAIMNDGSRYILNFDDYFLEILYGFVTGEVRHDLIKNINTLLSQELQFLQKLSDGHCNHFFIKNKESKIIKRVVPEQFNRIK